MPRPLVLAIPLFVFCAAACGEKKEQAPPSPPAAATVQPAAQEAPAPPPPPVVVTPDAEGVVRLTANDTMRFNATRIEVKAGKVAIELKNAGTLPKVAMGHNLIVLKAGTDPMAFAAAAVSAQATDYVPTASPHKDAILGHTKLLGPGESEKLELDLAAGTYPFLCSFPGHVALMNGQLVVQ